MYWMAEHSFIILDGEALIHHIPWIRGGTYKNVFTLYSDYVRRKYGNAIVIFDGFICQRVW